MSGAAKEDRMKAKTRRVIYSLEEYGGCSYCGGHPGFHYGWCRARAALSKAQAQVTA